MPSGARTKKGMAFEKAGVEMIMFIKGTAITLLRQALIPIHSRFSSSDGTFKSKTVIKKTEDLAAAAAKLNDPISLSRKQHDVLAAIMARKSVFFTGAAGTGNIHLNIIIILFNISNDVQGNLISYEF